MAPPVWQASAAHHSAQAASMLLFSGALSCPRVVPTWACMPTPLPMTLLTTTVLARLA